ncbi:MAG TPA: gamma-glutamyltransferase family protein [Levilinea sp.]|nr:gamma-glutamyltransferase family protein [Levilinea sp.]
MTDLSFGSRRSPVYGRHGMVAASQPLATAAGLAILQKGGNAADAAVATAAALNVTEPGSTGLGGDAFALYYDQATRQVSALNGSGRAPAALSLGRLQREGFTEHLPALHPYTITVPGACAAWCDLVERFGRLSMGEILAPAIRLAEEGFPVAPVTAALWQRAAENLLTRTKNGHELTIGGRGPRPGELFRNPGLARTLGALSEGGKEAYYRGSIAQAIVAVVRSVGGCLSVDDLAGHASTWDEPISVTYRDLRVWECPPNGQGLVALLALNILEGFDLAVTQPLSAQRLHLVIEALRLAFADARRYVADPDFAEIPLEGLLSKDYAARRRAAIDVSRAAREVVHGAPYSSSDTVYLSVVDGQGNACSFINSNYMGFGTGIVPQGWGFSLQNRGAGFSLQPGHFNALAPGKRPYHTIIPALVTHAAGDELYACFGVMGGLMQPQGHVQVMLALVEDGADPQAALDRPRLMISAESEPPRVTLEEGIPAETATALAALGHEVHLARGYERVVFGRGQIIRRDPESGVLWAGSDPRADGLAMTWTPDA